MLKRIERIIFKTLNDKNGTILGKMYLYVKGAFKRSFLLIMYKQLEFYRIVKLTFFKQ